MKHLMKKSNKTRRLTLQFSLTLVTPTPLSGPSTSYNVTPTEDDLLEILGEDPSNKNKYGPEIRSELASRMVHIATSGLNTELRKELMCKYPIPSNSIQIDASKLNIEIKAVIPETAIKRDKGIETKQKQMACVISCLSNVINSHINLPSKNNDELRKLMDINRILCDIQHADSVTKRNFIVFALKSDEFLFGENLPETLKSAKAVNKSGLELKANITTTKAAQRLPKPVNRLNYRAPPQSRRSQGQALPQRSAPRSRGPATQRAPPARPPPQSLRESSQLHRPRRD
ncbi:unnamed protein product, partial [Iphiclides podalirius]